MKTLSDMTVMEFLDALPSTLRLTIVSWMFDARRDPHAVLMERTATSVSVKRIAVPSREEAALPPLPLEAVRDAKRVTINGKRPYTKRSSHWKKK